MFRRKSCVKLYQAFTWVQISTYFWHQSSFNAMHHFKPRTKCLISDWSCMSQSAMNCILFNVLHAIIRHSKYILHDLLLFQHGTEVGALEHKRLNCVTNYCLPVTETLKEFKHGSFVVWGAWCPWSPAYSVNVVFSLISWQTILFSPHLIHT